MAVKDRMLRSCKQPEKFFGGKVTHMSCRYSAFPNSMTIISIGIIRVNFQYWYLAAPWKKSGPLPGPRPALGACSAGAEPAWRRLLACGRTASQPRPGAPGFGEAFAILKPERAD